jgi:diguanylate cyclase (GGDEF)-like protein/PAS domain S-box-containing protein
MRASKQISISGSIILLFTSILLVTIVSIGYLVFSRWYETTDKTIQTISESISDSIYEEISTFMHIPLNINDVNQKIITNGVFDMQNQSSREKFFVGVLSSCKEEIYSFSYGTAQGEYYGARRNELGAIEIMRNNATTGGNSWYYAVNDDLTAGNRVVEAGKFDPRTRAWYKIAEERGVPAMSPVYKHFIMNDLTISAAHPIYDSHGTLKGVLGTHTLLSDLGSYISEAVQPYNGFALIIEKETGSFIANSMGLANFTMSTDGLLIRNNIQDVQVEAIRELYAQYQTQGSMHSIVDDGNERFNTRIRELEIEGISWVIISAIPTSSLLGNIENSINMTIIMGLIGMIVSLTLYFIFTRRMLKPMNNLLQVAESLSSGNLSQRVEITREDEIGRIAKSMNKVADSMQFLINNLEDQVKIRTDELQLILDSTAEAIYGIDIQGNCTFCNSSSIHLLGYSRSEDLLGKNMHVLIHHSREDGSKFPIDECRIFKAIREGRGYEAEDEVFWKADGTSFPVAYHAYPKVREGTILGGVVTFMDITERKQKETQIDYLSSHDPLTTLFNRSRFEELSRQIDIPENLPISVIFADINGLKMTNDIFGHSAGDEMIKQSAAIIKRACRENDIVARIGGDEFVVLLPKVSESEVLSIIEHMRFQFKQVKIEAISCSISIGSDTKHTPEKLLKELLINAENDMYHDKTIHRQSVNKAVFKDLIKSLHSRSIKEKEHSNSVREISRSIGLSLQLTATEITKLQRAAFYHDIGKVALQSSLLDKDNLTDDEIEIMKQHPVIGYRILNLFDDTLNLAEYVYCHHERWDGNGYPRGLRGEQIPLLSRIIAIAEVYDRVMTITDGSLEMKEQAALNEIRDGAGTKFDPYLVSVWYQVGPAR